MQTTRLSSKGQVIIPQGIREAYHWEPGLEFDILETDAGILLTPHKPFKPTVLDEVVGCVRYRGKRKSLKEMEAGIAKGAKERR